MSRAAMHRQRNRGSFIPNFSGHHSLSLRWCCSNVVLQLDIITCSMKETEWGRTIGARGGSNITWYNSYKRPTEPGHAVRCVRTDIRTVHWMYYCVACSHSHNCTRCVGINLLVGRTFSTSVKITAICRNRCVFACMCAHVIEIEGDEHPFEPSAHTSPQWTGGCSTRCESVRWWRSW